MPDYNFEGIDAKLFEHLAVALCQAHVARGVRPFGPGPDGGREATFEGRMDYPSASAPWNGYLVVQCKRKETRGITPKEEADWAIDQLNSEMQKYVHAKVPRRTPEYFLFITNAELSAKPNEGGKDRFVASLDSWVATLGIRGADVWDREKLARLLDGTQDVAKRFNLLHSGDLINYVAQAVLSNKKGVETTLSLFLQEELRADQYVRLAQAGHVGDERTPLARVFVDLRATQKQATGTKLLVVQAIQTASDRPIYASLLDAEFEGAPKRGNDVEDDTSVVWHDPSRFVLVGGPGQGKSTLVQHLAQRHRAALLGRHSTSSLSYETTQMLRVIRKGAEESGVGIPSHARFPFRIVLEQFADALAKETAGSVLDFIAALIRRRTGRPFESGDAEQLIREVPCFVAFDGLDEVPAVSNRADVLAAVRRFLVEARILDADLLVVATTRPQGYEDEFSPAYFNHLYLTPLEQSEALDYARRFVDTKYATDADRRERVIKRLEAAASEEATARLMVSPLQVTIMAALVDVVGNPPRERYPLFDRYYEVVYQREQERGIGSSEVLAEYRADINALHDRVGLLLQIATERAGQAQGRISGAQLRELVTERLISVGYEGDELTEITQSLVDVALHRLVFIVPLEEDQYGFEVRSLQEFAAARALMRRGSPQQIKQRLWAIAPVPYWRNTVLFAVGLLFAEREDLSDTVTQLCRELNEDDDPALFHSRAGSRLSLDILNDGVVDRRPKHRRSLLETSLLLLDIADDSVMTQLAGVYRPEDQARFIASIRATVSRDYSSGTGVFRLLVELVSNDVEWAHVLLRELWPRDVNHARWIFEETGESLTWSGWQVAAAVDVARNSSPTWVAQYLAEWVSVPWIAGTQELDRGIYEAKRIPLYGDERNAAYLCPQIRLADDLLQLICDAAPIHSGWAGFIDGRDFLRMPSAETLAQTMTALATRQDAIETYFHRALPWPLQALLRKLRSRDALTLIAEKARDGIFGDLQDWRAAEERWATRGFSPEDFEVFDDEIIPFTSAVGEAGIVPLLMTVRGSDPRATIEGLRTAFNSVKSERQRQRIADDICFCIIAYSRTSANAGQLPRIPEFVDIARSARSWLDGNVVHAVYRDSTDPLVDLEVVGDHLRLPGVRTLFRSQRNALSTHVAGSTITKRIADETGGKTVSEGLVRFLAGLAVVGVPATYIEIDSRAFSAQGQVALVALNLFTEGLYGLPAYESAQLARELWTHENLVTGEVEVPNIIRFAARGLNRYSIQVLDLLLRQNLPDRELTQIILNGMNSVTQYRTSRLGDDDRQNELGLKP